MAPNMEQFNAIILFADLMSSSRMSDVLSSSEYLNLLKSFQDTGNEMLSQLSLKLRRLGGTVRFCEGNIRGEEIQIVVGFDEFENLPSDSASKNKLRLMILSILETAIELSLNWFLSPVVNRIKHEELATPSRLGIGLHFGKVYPFKAKMGKWDQAEWKILGHENIHIGSSINFGKRVETASRLSNGIGISLSNSFHTLCVKYGVPVVSGEKLEGAPKGFEYPQPIFDLKQQYAVLTSDSLSKNAEKLQSLYKSLYHDPNRIQAYYSLAVESLIDVASFSNDQKRFDSAVDYSEYLLGVFDDSEYFHWLKAIALYRRASVIQNYQMKRRDIDTSILHYERASQKIAWAYLDLAAAYWTRSGIEKIRDKKINDLKYSRELLSGLIQRDPLLFHAYNLRALVSAELAKQLQNDNNLEGEKLLEEADTDIGIARSLNDQPKYLYLGTLAIIENARGKLRGSELPQARERVINLTDDAEVKLKHAIAENKKLRGVSEEKIPDYHFWRQGYTDPPYHPPRPTSLRTAWTKLREGV